MALRGKNPAELCGEKRAKILLYGEPGVGKTTTALKFPAPYIIDTEKGAEHKDYLELLTKNKGAIFQSCDYDDIMDEVKSLTFEKHPFKTLVIDSITPVFEGLKRSYGKDEKIGTLFSRDKHAANGDLTDLGLLLLRLDMNIIITSHAKMKYKMIADDYSGKKTLEAIGFCGIGIETLSYIFDFEAELQFRGKRHVGNVSKTRFKEPFPVGKDISLEFKDIAEKYGEEILLKECEKAIQISEVTGKKIHDLIVALKISADKVQRWLTKFEVDKLSSLTEENGLQIIDAIFKKHPELAN